MGVCNCSMFCCTLLYVHSSIAIILMGKRELVALLNLSSWCFVMVKGLFLTVPRGCLQFVIVIFPDHTHLLFLISCNITFELFDKVDMIIKSSLEDHLRLIHFPPPFCTHRVSVMSETKSQLYNRSTNYY